MDEVRMLEALAVVAGDPVMGPRFLALTGMDAAQLRARAGDPALLEALGDFLAAHEPDLERVAAALGVAPGELLR